MVSVAPPSACTLLGVTAVSASSASLVKFNNAELRFFHSDLGWWLIKLKAIAENQHAATKDAQLDDFIAEAISRGDSQFSEIGLGDLHFSGEAVVRGTDLIV